MATNNSSNPKELTLGELFAADRARGDGSREPVEMNYIAEIARLCARIDAKDEVFQDNINHAGTIEKKALKAALGQICNTLSNISGMYSKIPEICNQLTDIITVCIKETEGVVNPSPEVNIKFEQYSVPVFSYMYVLNNSTIIIPIAPSSDYTKFHIFAPYGLYGYHNSCEYSPGYNPINIISGTRITSAQNKNIKTAILKCLNEPPRRITGN